MINGFGHYVIHGSEYLLGLATKLTRSNPDEDYRQRLRTIGIPTVLEVDIPVSYLTHRQQLSLARTILAAWGQLRTRRALSLGSAPCYVIGQNIPPECIKRHYHPHQIHDAHSTSGEMYTNRKIVCDMCK